MKHNLTPGELRVERVILTDADTPVLKISRPWSARKPMLFLESEVPQLCRELRELYPEHFGDGRRPDPLGEALNSGDGSYRP